MEFRHRYSNNDRLTPREEETRVLLQNSDHCSEVVEHISKSYKKAEEGPSAKEEAQNKDFRMVQTVSEIKDYESLFI